MESTCLDEAQASHVNETLLMFEDNLAWMSEFLKGLSEMGDEGEVAKGLAQAHDHIEKAREALFGVLPEPGASRVTS